MPINSISVENFTAFEKIEIDFCAGINVFIGENGTGKTHLLKILYAFCESEFTQEQESGENIIFRSDFNCKLRNYFQSEGFNRLTWCRDDIANDNKINIIIDMHGVKYNFEIDKDIDEHKPYIFCRSVELKGQVSSVYIPAKEMLSYAGLEKDFRERNMSFDMTLIDILKKSEIPDLKELPDSMREILNSISKTIGGKVVFTDGQYYVDKGNGLLIDFAAEAEGFKRLGLIYRLIETGYIKKGSVLIWDEPEANINPKLIPIIIKTLQELSRQGTQVFVATHDYNFMKYFSVKKKHADELVFFSLYETENGTACERAEDYDLLENNPIIDANTKLLEDEIEGTL